MGYQTRAEAEEEKAAMPKSISVRRKNAMKMHEMKKKAVCQSSVDLLRAGGGPEGKFRSKSLQLKKNAEEAALRRNSAGISSRASGTPGGGAQP